MTLGLYVIAVVVAAVAGLPTISEDDGATLKHRIFGHCQPSKIWIVLAAGSSGWGDYGIQSNICHAYQLFRAHGVPDKQIIVMMYDDIAYNEENPNLGVIINKPGGPNVYPHVPKDYIGENVTPENFLNVITGNKSAMEGIGSGKVLLSGPNDHVFINFVGRGGEGVIAFPSDYLYADDLIDALNTMHQKNMYKQLLVYLDTSFSGSMFDGLLPSNTNILAVSSSQPSEYSYFTYFDDDLDVYIALLFSVAWMEDIDSEEHHKNLTTETLLHQYKNVAQRLYQTEGITPGLYGTKGIAKSRITKFFGKDLKRMSQSYENFAHTDRFQDAVKSTDVHLYTLKRRIQKTQNDRERQILQNRLDALLKGRSAIDDVLNNIMNRLSSEGNVIIEEGRLSLTLDMFGCYKTLVDAFNKQCVNITRNPYVLRYLYKFANICAVGSPSSEDVLKAFTTECASHDTFLNIH